MRSRGTRCWGEGGIPVSWLQQDLRSEAFASWGLGLAWDTWNPRAHKTLSPQQAPAVLEPMEPGTHPAAGPPFPCAPSLAAQGLSLWDPEAMRQLPAPACAAGMFGAACWEHCHCVTGAGLCPLGWWGPPYEDSDADLAWWSGGGGVVHVLPTPARVLPAACPRGRFGEACAQSCRCPPDTTCHHVTGECHCPPGVTRPGCKQGRLTAEPCPDGGVGGEATPWWVCPCTDPTCLS